MNGKRTGRRTSIATLALVVLIAPVLSGCIGELDQYYSFEADEKYVNPGVFPGTYQLAAGPAGSSVLELGKLPWTKHAEVFHLRSLVDGEFIPVAVWRPYDGLVDGGVPVIVDAGPYFEMWDVDDEGNPDPGTIDRLGQRGEFVTKNFVPHGYAYAQIAVRGTGTHGGCMELMSQQEAQDISQAITFLGQQPWSNGNVSMIGASYDGSTPWLVAAQGNEHLKAIVPVSGLPDIFDLMFHNGTSETRGPIMHSVVYWPFGFNYNDVTGFGVANKERDAWSEAMNAACPEMVKGTVMGPYAAVTGARDPDAIGYWNERNYRDDILANYEGSVFLIHGLQDWNVDPHAAIPFNQQLKDAGIEVKEWYGQWGHAYPDSQCPKSYPDWLWTACRLDFAEVLLRYFDATLKGLDRDHGPMIQLQDNYGYWRNAESYPAQNAEWVEFFPSLDGRMGNESGSRETAVLAPPGALAPAFNGPANYLEFKTPVFEEDVRISGLPQFHVGFESMGPGGFLGAWVLDEDEEGRILHSCFYHQGLKQTFCSPTLVAHGQIDLRFYEGGDEPSPTAQPGQAYVAKLELEPLEVLVPKGHRLTVWLFQYAYPDHFASPVPSPVRVVMGGNEPTVLRLPKVEVDPLTIFPVPGSHTPDPTNYWHYMRAKPYFEQVVPPVNEARAAHAACLDALRAQGAGLLAGLAGTPAACRDARLGLTFEEAFGRLAVPVS